MMITGYCWFTVCCLSDTSGTHNVNQALRIVNSIDWVEMLAILEQKRLLRVVECCYASLALFALTQGPVQRLWAESAVRLDLLPEPSVAHAQFATFVIAQLPGVLLWFRRVDHGWLRARSNQLLVLLLSWLGLSVAWSTFARQSLPEFVALVVTSMFGLYLSEAFTNRQLWCIVAAATAFGLGASWFSIVRLWEGAVSLQDDYWVGIYGNRNSLSPIAALAMLSVLGIICDRIPRTRRHSIQDVFGAILSILIVICSGVILWRSRSQTSPVALVIVISASCFWLLLRWVSGRLRVLSKFRVLSARVTLALLGLGMFLMMQLISTSSSLSSDTTTFNSRRALWAVNWSGFLEKPWQGWGWMAARLTPDFFHQGIWWAATETRWSHNGYHDFLLGGGVLAGVLFFAYVWASSRGFDIVPASIGLPRFAVCVFVLTASTQESFFVGSHVLWALLVAVLVDPRRVRLSAEE